jgi:hypothetical protein
VNFLGVNTHSTTCESDLRPVTYELVCQFPPTFSSGKTTVLENLSHCVPVSNKEIGKHVK